MPFPMTSSDLQGHTPVANFFKCNFLYNCVAADKISTDIACHAVPLQYLSLVSVKVVAVFAHANNLQALLTPDWTDDTSIDWYC